MTEPFTERLTARLAPWNTPSLEILASAIGIMWQPILELAEEEGEDGTTTYIPAYGRLFNVEECPAGDLGYLAQYVGTRLPNEATTAEKRALIKEQPASLRGTLTAVETAIYRNTTLTKEKASLLERGYLIERRASNGTENAYEFGVLVPAANITSQAGLEQAVFEAKPGGVIVWYNSGGKYTFAEATGKWSEDTMTWAETATVKP